VLSGVAACLCPRRERLRMVQSAVLTAPVSAFAFVYIPEYWNPSQVARWCAGPEDLLFGCAAGAIVWVLAVRTLGAQLHGPRFPVKVVLRFAALMVGGLAAFFSLRALALGPMDASLVTLGMIAAVLLGGRPKLWRMVAVTAPGYAAIHMAVQLVSVSLWPQLAGQWNHTELWGLAVGGVPLEELAWATAFGATWPALVIHVLDLRLAPIGRDADQ
jgi:hypothetical protein